MYFDGAPQIPCAYAPGPFTLRASRHKPVLHPSGRVEFDHFWAVWVFGWPMGHTRIKIWNADRFLGFANQNLLP